MLKDNHIDACGGIVGTVEKLRSSIGHTVKIEIETRNLDSVTHQKRQEGLLMPFLPFYLIILSVA